MFLYDLRHAARRLVREPRFTFAAVLTLALGVGANVAVFAVVEAILLRPLHYADADRLVTLNHRDERTGITKPFNAVGDYVDFADRQKSFDAFGAYGSGEATIFGMGDPFRVSALVVTSGAFDALGVRPVLGRGIQPEDSRPGAGKVMLLGYDLSRSAMRWWGTPSRPSSSCSPPSPSCSSSPASTWPTCCSPARSRGGGKWRCAWPSGREPAGWRRRC